MLPSKEEGSISMSGGDCDSTDGVHHSYLLNIPRTALRSSSGVVVG